MKYFRLWPYKTFPHNHQKPKMIFMKPVFPPVAFLFAMTLISCGGKKEQVAAEVPEVNVVEVGKKDIPVYAEYVGQTYGQSDIEIKPRVEGWVQSVNFKEGSVVKKGQLLYTIQDDELRDR